MRFSVSELHVKFEKAQLGDDAGIMGAFVLAQEGVK